MLINGKRRHRSAFVDVATVGGGAQAVDLSQVPQIALQRVEVLRDGASAQYGSDAIAGVINLILREQLEPTSYLQWGEYAEGDGESVQGAVSGGIRLGDSGSLTLSGEYTKSDATSRSLQRPQAAALIAQGEPYASSVRQPAVQRFGQPDLEAYRFFYNATLDLSDTVSAYAFGNYAEAKASMISTGVRRRRLRDSHRAAHSTDRAFRTDRMRSFRSGTCARFIRADSRRASARGRTTTPPRSACKATSLPC